jgi:hypothetical protein
MQAFWPVLGLSAWAIALTLQFVLRRPDRAGALVPGVILPWFAVLACGLPHDPELALMGAWQFSLIALLVASLGAMAGSQGAKDVQSFTTG